MSDLAGSHSLEILSKGNRRVNLVERGRTTDLLAWEERTVGTH